MSIYTYINTPKKCTFIYVHDLSCNMYIETIKHGIVCFGFRHSSVPSIDHSRSHLSTLFWFCLVYPISHIIPLLHHNPLYSVLFPYVFGFSIHLHVWICTPFRNQRWPAGKSRNYINACVNGKIIELHENFPATLFDYPRVASLGIVKSDSESHKHSS